MVRSQRTDDETKDAAMDHPFDILTADASHGRDIVLGLRNMNIRVVVADEATKFMTCGSSASPEHAHHTAGARFQPRDEFGRFVPYWVVALEVVNDFIDIEEAYRFEDGI